MPRVLSAGIDAISRSDLSVRGWGHFDEEQDFRLSLSIKHALLREQKNRTRLSSAYEATWFNKEKVMLCGPCNGSGVELRTLDHENPGSNPVLRC